MGCPFNLRPFLIPNAIMTFSQSLLSVFLILPICTPVMAQAAYQQVDQERATTRAISVHVHSGRMTSIDFQNVQEIITYIGLGDASRLVYHTNLPLESGRANTLFLQPIQPLTFPGATRHDITNLVVQTRDSEQNSHLYNFNIIHVPELPSHLGIQIIPSSPSPPQIEIGWGRQASLEDVEMGLFLAIRKGYTSPSDPIVLAVRECLALVRHHELSLTQAADQAGVNMAVLVELAKITWEVYQK